MGEAGLAGPQWLLVTGAEMCSPNLKELSSVVGSDVWGETKRLIFMSQFHASRWLKARHKNLQPLGCRIWLSRQVFLKGFKERETK